MARPDGTNGLKPSYRAPATFATIARLRNQLHARSNIVETKARRFYISGRVQGVGFRFFVEHTAIHLGVGGFARNLFDGRVEVYAVGTADQLDALKSALRRGPRMAAVDEVREEDAELLRNYASTFSIEGDE